MIKVKVCSVILIRFCMLYAYTRLRYQMSVYRTVGPLVIIINAHVWRYDI